MAKVPSRSGQNSCRGAAQVDYVVTATWAARGPARGADVLVAIIGEMGVFE